LTFKAFASLRYASRLSLMSGGLVPGDGALQHPREGDNR
jgi:hypothetical protein